MMGLSVVGICSVTRVKMDAQSMRWRVCFMLNTLPVFLRNLSPMSRQMSQMAMQMNPKNPLELLLDEKSHKMGANPMRRMLVMAMVQLWMPRMVVNFLFSPPMQQKM